MPEFTRRRFVKTSAGLVPITLAGCTGGGDGTDTPTPGGDGGTVQTPTGDGTTDEIVTGGTLRWAGSAPVQSLDPHKSGATQDSLLAANVYEGLTYLDFDSNISPELAKSWEASEDGTLLTFELREGVKFHNGADFTSRDVVASFERIMEFESLPFSGTFNDTIEEIAAPDDHTIELHLVAPQSGMLGQFGKTQAKILQADIVEDAGEDDIEPVGTGPFKIEDWQPEDSLTLTRFEDYSPLSEDPSDTPYLDRIEKDEISDADARINSFLAENADLLEDTPPQRIDELRNNDDIRQEPGGFFVHMVYMFNHEREPGNDLNYRLACEYAIDREEILEAALFGHGEIAYQPDYPGSPMYQPDLEMRQHDLDKAQEHLDQSDVADVVPDVIYPTELGQVVSTAEILEAQLSAAGIQINLQEVPFGRWLQQVAVEGTYDSTVIFYAGHWWPDGAYYRNLHPEGSQSFSNWVNDDYADLVEQARLTFDIEEQQSLYRRAAEVFYEDSPVIWTHYGPQQHAVWNNVHGPLGHPSGIQIRFKTFWMDQ